jgi:hypothetical protein
MALNNNSRRTGWHFWVRLAGLTGLAALAVGLVLMNVTDEPAGLYTAGAGVVLVLLALLIEARSAVGLVRSRRGALGSNVFLQVLLAAALLAGVNAFSFFHHARFDWTRDRLFTIEPTIQEQLARLRDETRIVVYQRHTSFGQLSERPDNYDSAAERRIVEKVKDLAEQFQELGPRFRVELLDIQEDGFQDRLAALKKEAPKLAEAIEATPENSIFFYARGKVQRLGFHDVYELDKEASRADNGGRGNLVLRYQGAGPFARKVLNVDEKRPRVVVAAIHEILGLESSEEPLGMAGAKKALAEHGFDSGDIILKQWPSRRGGMPEPAVLTLDEFKYQRLELDLAQIDATVKSIREQEGELKRLRSDWSTMAAPELAKKYAIVRTLMGPQVVAKAVVDDLRKRSGREPPQVPIVEETKRSYLEYLGEILPEIADTLKQVEQRRAEKAEEQSRLNVEGLAEQRRIADLRAKLSRLLADCDLLIVPRWTLLNVARGERIPSWVYHLEEAQLEAVKDFVKSGKPALFCLSPSNEPPDAPPPPGLAGGPDRLKPLLEDLGFRLPQQTILFDVEGESLAEQQSGLILLGPQAEVPTVQFDWPEEARELRALGPGLTKEDFRRGNPIRTSLLLAARSVGKQGALDLRLRNPRPVYYDPAGAPLPDLSVTFMMTGKDCWNEAQPFPTEERTPKFERPKAGDRTRGTLEEERQGPFPIGAAVQTKVPASWYGDKHGDGPAVRVAVVGHGGIFSGARLTPAKEKVLVDVSNWLLGRDDLLARDTPPWKYPRVQLTEEEDQLWKWGMRAGLPLLFVYLGLVVLMVRRMR